MKLYTKSGDDGTTSLFGGTRVPKTSRRVAAYGDVDEANAALGLAVAAEPQAVYAEALLRIQGELFCIGASLASPTGDAGIEKVGTPHIEQLERWVDEFHDDLPPMKTFVLPGGCQAAACLHHARTVCRRAERTVADLSTDELVDRDILIYLNRLSDLLFALARRANFAAGVPDIPWIAPRQD
ncbi:MAG: cob(I)yrinic acid a,c-diamide adenosyltransferase [Phycisphaerae bacterium]